MFLLSNDRIERFTIDRWTPVEQYMLDGARDCLECAPGVAAIQVQPNMSHTRLLLPDEIIVKDNATKAMIAKSWRRQSVGTIMAVNNDLPSNIEESSYPYHKTDFKPGDKVLFQSFLASQTENFCACNPAIPNWYSCDLMAMTGRENRIKNLQAEFTVKPVPLSHTIMATIETDIENQIVNLKPVKKWILGLRDEMTEQTQSGLYLPDSAHKRPMELTVLRHGELCEYAREGARFMYQNASQILLWRYDPRYDKRLVLVEEDALQAELRQTAPINVEEEMNGICRKTTAQVS